LITQLQYQLRSDLAYHFRYSFHHVAITWWKEPIEVVLNHANGGAHPRQLDYRAMVLTRATGGAHGSEYSPKNRFSMRLGEIQTGKMLLSLSQRRPKSTP
jgi:hypothetical protein